MLRDVACNLCGQDHYRILYKSEKGPEAGEGRGYMITETFLKMPERIVKCLRCGLVYVNPRRDDKEMSASYVNMADKEYALEERGRSISSRAMLKRLARFKKAGRILDIGCATGFLLNEAKKQGWEVYGVELSKWCAGYAKENFGLDIFCGPLNEAGYQMNFFDAVVLRDTIEHLTNPKETLAEIRRVLKPDGILCISTPNIDSVVSRALRGRWWGINQSHLFYFTKRSLYTMLDAAGFSPLKCRSHPRTFSFRYWVVRFENYNRFIYMALKFLADKTFLGKALFTINTADQIEVYARRSRKLEYIEEFEGRPNDAHAHKKKMKVIVVLPAYNAAKTLKKTVEDIPEGAVDGIILVDDKSQDETVLVARQLGIAVFEHEKNKGYGGNQKTCYQKALETGADIIIMVHPDYQYDPKAVTSLIEPIKNGEADAVFGSRMMKGGALIGGMPPWKHNSNIMLTAVENVVFGTYLTEYHSGFRAYSAEVLRTVRFMDNSDDFIFDTEIIAQMLLHYFKIEEVPIRTRYFDEASTIKIFAAIKYGVAILITLAKFILHTRTFIKFRQFD
ncbi:MAG: methyltransferase domain-containing protein [Candidatus Omnitrophica bacterium]|nr:methyltransferase domain-containing protein [Candidatus Omnitrophota bacterium]